MNPDTAPHWAPEADFSGIKFHIRRMDTSGYIRAAQVPASRLPLIGFLYLTDGELLAEVDGKPYLCYPGQLLLIPENRPFAIRYYENARGYTGGFSASALSGPRNAAYFTEPVHTAFWFDEASFIGELFNMMASSFEKGRYDLVEKGLDLLLSMAHIPDTSRSNPVVARFLDSIFAPEATLGMVDDYAREAGVSANWLGRMVKKESGRSVGAWIELARLTKAKRLLQETGMPVIDVATAVGLEDQSYFSRFFRKHTGFTPSQFRSKMNGPGGQQHG